MSKIDQRVVEMKFKNKDFEAGIKTSMTSLKNFEKSLKFKNAGKGLDNLQKKTSKFSLDGIASGVNKLTDRFSTMGIIGITVLQNITNSALDAGKRIASALTIDPIKSGFQEYELKMGAIQTIMAGTGRSLDDVNASLDRMNEYSDKTIYSFADMTSNVGKFTNAGIGLEDAEKAMMGINNWAALAGAGTHEASMAMYNLSQAMSMGKLTVMDYKSIENANMATMQFKQHLIDTGLAAGTLKETSKGMYKAANGEGNEFTALKGFRDELNSGWADTEVMTKALQGYSDETTELGKRANAAATEVKTVSLLIDTMKEAVQSGWTTSWEMIIGDKEQSVKTLTALGSAFEQLIKPGIEARNTMLEFWNTTGGRDDVIQGLKNIFVTLGNTIKPFKDAFREIFPPMTGPKLVAISASFLKLTEGFKMGSKTAEHLKNTFKGVFAILNIGKMAIVAVTKGLLSIVSVFIPLGGGIVSITSKFGNFFSSIEESLRTSNTFGKIVGGISAGLVFLITNIKGATKFLVDFIKNLKIFKGMTVEKTVHNLKDSFSGFSKIGPFFNGVFDAIVSGFKNIGPTIGKIVSTIGDGFGKVWSTIKNVFSKFDASAGLKVLSGGVMAAILLDIRRFTKEMPRFGDIIDGITDVLYSVRNTFKAYQTQLKAGALMKIAGAIGIMTLAILALSLIDPVKLAKALGGMTIMLIALVKSMKSFEEIAQGSGFGKLAGLGLALMGVAIAVTILASAAKKIAKMSMPELIQGLGGVFALLTGISIFLNRTKFDAQALGASVGLIAMAIALRIMIGAVSKIGEMDSGVLIQGLLGVAVALGVLSKFIAALNNKKIFEAAAAFLVLSVALHIIVRAIIKMSEIDFEKSGKGLFIIAIALGVVSTALNSMPKDAKAKAKSLLVVATSMVILGYAIQQMSQLSWMEIAKGLGTIAAALLILVVALNGIKMEVSGAAALLVVAIGLNALIIPLAALGAMSWEAILKGLVGLAGIMAVMGVAAALMAPVAPVLVTIGVGLTLIGIGAALAGLGLMAFAAGITALTIAGAPAMAMLGAFTLVLFKMAIDAAKAAGTFVVEFLKVIASKIGEIVNAGVSLFINFVKGMIQRVDELVKIGSDFIIKILLGITSKIVTIVQAGVDLLVAFIKGITSKVRKLVDAGVDLLTEFLKGVSSRIGDVIESGVDVIISFVEGMAASITKNTKRMTTAIGNLLKAMGKAALTMLGTFIGGFLTKGKELISSLIKGIGAKLGDVKNKISELGTAAKDKLLTFKDKFLSAGKDVVAGFISGMGAKLKDITDKASELGSKAFSAIKKKLEIKSPSKKFIWIGNMLGLGMIKGINQYGGKVSKAAAQMGDDAFANAKLWMDAKKYYNELTLKEELKGWETLAKKYKPFTEQRIEADKEVYRLKNELIKNDFEEAKYYNKLSLTDELKHYEKLSKTHREGTEERKAMDKEVYRIHQEIADKKKAIDDEYYNSSKALTDKLADDAKSLRDAYDNALKSRADAIYNSYGLFEEIKNEESVGGYALLQNLENQINTLSTWRENIIKLTAKGVDAKLISELEAMGPKSGGELTSLVNMTDEQLTKYEDLWKTKHALALSSATTELEGMRVDTQDQINKLAEETQSELVKVKEVWVGSMAELGIVNSDQIGEVVKDWAVGTQKINKDTTSEFKSLTTNIKKINWSGVGRDIIQGIIQGINSQRSQLINAAVSVALSAYIAAKSALQINSPSRMFAKLGEFSVMGMVKGLLDNASKVRNASSEVGDGAIHGMKSAVGMLSAILDDEIDINPTIRPVLDLSDLKKNAGGIKNLLANPTSYKAVNQIATSVNKDKTPIPVSSRAIEGVSKVEFTQNNYSPKALSRIEIYRQTKNQVSVLKGVVNT